MAPTIKKIFIGEDPISRVYHKGKAEFPVPILDNPTIRYDFVGRTNVDRYKDTAHDLTGNGNDGTLKNFAYTLGSGYQSEKEVAERNLLRYPHSVEIYHPLNTTQTRMYAGLVAGQQYTFSADYEILEGNPRGFLLYPWGSSNGWYEMPATGAVGKVVQTFTPKDTQVPYLTLYSGVSNAGAIPTDVRFTNLKLQKGSVATPWTPAPEEADYHDVVHYSDRGLAFDGVDDYLTFYPATQSVPTLEYTVEFKLNSYRELGSYQCLLALNSPTYMMIRNSGKTLFFSFSTDTQRTFSSDFVIVPDVHYRIRVVYDGEQFSVYNHDEFIISYPLTGNVNISNAFSRFGYYAGAYGLFDGDLYKLEIKY